MCHKQCLVPVNPVKYNITNVCIHLLLLLKSVREFWHLLVKKMDKFTLILGHQFKSNLELVQIKVK